MKPIVYSTHAAERMRQRGATADEIETAIRNVGWQPAPRDRWTVKMQLVFDALSPVNQQRYRYKKIEVLFAEDPNAIVVITVKAFYHN